MKQQAIDLIRDVHFDIRRHIGGITEKPKDVKNFSQMKIMFYLNNHENEVIYQKDICNALKLKKSSITEHLDYLENIGLIERIQDAKDKRKNSIKLSERALCKKNEIDEILKQLNERVIKDIPEEDLDTFERIINKMKENLKD